MCAPPRGIICNSSVTAKLLNKLTSQFICVNIPCLETQSYKNPHKHTAVVAENNESANRERKTNVGHCGTVVSHSPLTSEI